MNKSIYSAVIAGIMTCVAVAQAAPLPAELKMPGDRSWKGTIISRDGDWIEFSTGGKPIRIGASTIDELVFEVKIDSYKLNEMNRNREYARIIGALERTLAPYKEYSDIRSNLTTYNALLMEMHYKTASYGKAIELASRIVLDDRDPKLQEQARVYSVLSLIGAGKLDKAEALITAYGWTEGLDDTASPQKLYIMAKLLTLKKQYADAMELVAKVVAFNSQDPEWMQPAELLCAEVYTELKMYDSAEEVIRQISLLYGNTNEDDQAQKLKIRIEKLRAEQELEEEATESEEV